MFSNLRERASRRAVLTPHTCTYIYILFPPPFHSLIRVALPGRDVKSCVFIVQLNHAEADVFVANERSGSHVRAALYLPPVYDMLTRLPCTPRMRGASRERKEGLLRRRTCGRRRIAQLRPQTGPRVSVPGKTTAECHAVAAAPALTNLLLALPPDSAPFHFPFPLFILTFGSLDSRNTFFSQFYTYFRYHE